MGGSSRRATVEELLAETSWLRNLALRLARDADIADDLVQETWIAAIRRAPEKGESLRPWLAKVLRNALRMRARSEGRRAAREQSSLDQPDEVPTPESLVAKAEAQRLLADLVLRLDEPYRSTVLLHFCEGLTLAEIARGHGVAASTARWRLKIALDQLRGELDAASGDRQRWVLVPLLAIPKGALVAQKTTKLAAAVAILLLLAGGLYLARRHQAGGDDPSAKDQAGATPSAGRLTPEAAAQEPTTAWLIQPDVTPRRIAGRVIFGGEPVSGATVELASLASESGIVTPPRRTTDAAGEFDFGPQPAIEWSVRASAPGKTGASIPVDLRNPIGAPPPERLEIELGPCEAALVGTVRDASGGAIAGARLARLPRGRSSVPGGVAVETDGGGAFELCVERSWPGRVFVEVSATGYGAIVYTGLVVGRVTVEFALVPEATIVGRVVRDDTGDPVPRAHVYLPRGPWGTESTSWRGTFTDEDGRFRIDQVAPGRHRVFARAQGLVAPPRGTPVVVEAGQTSESIEIRLEAGSMVSGVVLEDGEPVAGARVAAVAPDGMRSARTAVSQDDGSFTLDEVPRGEVRFTAWPYDVVSPTRFVVERGVHRGVVLEVESLGAIVGRVVRGQRGVAGARVHIHGPNEREVPPIAAGADGRFEARGLRPGPWTLYGEDASRGVFGRAPEIIQLAKGATEEVTIDLKYGAAISGVVVDQRGDPVPGVSVQFFHTQIDDAGMAVTAEDGRFRAATMTGGGTYRTVVRPYQGSRATLPPTSGGGFPLIELADGDSEVTGVVLAVQLDRLSIAGRVVDSSGAPVADARVAAAVVEGGVEPRFFRWVHHAAAITDVDGGFSIGELSKGSYALQARAPSGAEVTRGPIRAGRAGVVLTLPAAAAIEGTLIGFRERPEVTATRIDVRDSTLSTPGTVGTAGPSSFAIRELSPGTYAVLARTATEAAAARVELAAGATARVTLTAGGTGSVVGRVREFRTGKPVEGMTCRAQARVGTELASGFDGTGARSDSSGAFVLAEVPAGDIVVACHGLWRVYSDGMRLVEVAPDKRVQIDVPVVAVQGDVAFELGGFGADIDRTGALVPRLIQVKPGGPAAVAGFRDGDQVIAVDGESVTELSPGGVRLLITNRPAGSEVELTVLRNGQQIRGKLTLIEYEP